MAKPRDRHILEAFLTNSEAVIDSFTDNEALKSVPVIGTAFKICKGIDDLRSRALMAKLAKFIGAPSLQADSVKQNLKEKLLSEDEQVKIGETLFLVIERVTDLEKPALLARVFCAYLDDVVSASTLLRLTHAIDVAYIEDLMRLLEPGADGTMCSLHNGWRQGLIGAGLALPSNGIIGQVDYGLTQLAIEFRTAVAHASSLEEQMGSDTINSDRANGSTRLL